MRQKLMLLSGASMLLGSLLLSACPKDADKVSQSQQVQSGFDLNGAKKDCVPLPKGTICTQVFTLEDEFASRCREAGKNPTPCGCHEWICSEPLTVK